MLKFYKKNKNKKQKKKDLNIFCPENFLKLFLFFFSKKIFGTKKYLNLIFLFLFLFFF